MGNLQRFRRDGIETLGGRRAVGGMGLKLWRVEGL